MTLTLERLAVTRAAAQVLAARHVAQGSNWRSIARPKQLPPEGDWLVWLIRTGRGWGKTRTGAEWVREQVDAGRQRIALVGETAADARDVMVEGESGIMACSLPSNRPLYEPSKRRLTWPNGAIATTYSGDDPDQLRGPQHDAAWVDELAKMRRAQETWDNLMFGLRLGQRPQTLVTTTPRPLKLLRDLIAMPSTVQVQGHTEENLENLALSYREQVIARYEGTRLGRQELAGEILEDVEGALWTLVQIDALRVKEAPALSRVVVAIDPAVTSNEDSDETGIIVAGVADGHGYVLADLSGRYSPDAWARRAISALDLYHADRIVAEVNNGGDLVEATLRTIDRGVPYKAVHASRGKVTRAEPVAALFEQGKCHVVGSLPRLEDQLTTWSQGMRSPDRLDACVWALTELMLGGRELSGLPIAGKPTNGQKPAMAGVRSKAF